MSSLSADKIEIRYDSERPPALAELTLAVRKHEFLGVVGPNGSGKSTLVRALSRTLRPSRGCILLDDQDLYGATSARSAAQTIGTVPQSTNIAFEFTVREIVQMGRMPHLPNRIFASETLQDEVIVNEALKWAGVAHLADRIVTALSGGEQQRVLLARALAQQPEIILLDEPTSHLDLRHQLEVLSLVRRLTREQGKAALAVLHDLDMAAEFCDRLVLLHEGRILAQGSPTEVLTSDHLQRAYGVDAWVRSHPITGRPTIVPLPERPEILGAHVHVICGAGTGVALMVALQVKGFLVTAGALNIGDVDHEVALRLNVAHTQIAPFTAIPLDQGWEGAHCVIFTDMPIGLTNLASLQSALEAQRQGVPVLCVNESGADFSKRDFTNGVALELWDLLLASGATCVEDDSAALKLLDEQSPEFRTD